VDDAAAAACNLNKGDPVTVSSGGVIQLAADGADIYGVFQGMKRLLVGGYVTPYDFYVSGTAYGASSGDLVPRDLSSLAVITPVRNAVWMAQADDTTTATTYSTYRALVGENVDHFTTRDATNTANIKADPLLDMSTHLTSAGGWRIVDVPESPGLNRDFTGLYVSLIVEANEVLSTPGAPGTGV
jgi:hypothetical protein